MECSAHHAPLTAKHALQVAAHYASQALSCIVAPATQPVPVALSKATLSPIPVWCATLVVLAAAS